MGYTYNGRGKKAMNKLKKKVDLKRLNRLERLYFYLLKGRAGAFYWHYSKDYEDLKKVMITIKIRNYYNG